MTNFKPNWTDIPAGMTTDEFFALVSMTKREWQVRTMIVTREIFTGVEMIVWTDLQTSKIIVKHGQALAVMSLDEYTAWKRMGSK